MSVNFTTLVIVAVQEQPEIVRRQVVITQTITSPGYTSTALVTLDRGPTSSSTSDANWSAGAASSDGLGQAQIGIIVGCCIGALVLGIVIWCCCTRRCGCARYTAYENEQGDETTWYTDDTVVIARPPGTYKFPRSITPPLEPDYVANPNFPRWTASYDAYRQPRSHYYGG
ncbi:hypothetical protein F5B19DRAFT_428855 [Rostrohypoxylon terebratum]|nr:hypothetical protein F5B19DRAFT_428855 [Rostrohypoxylon terebratum]